MAFLCPMVPERQPSQTVYTLKRARTRRLQTLRPLLVSGEDTKTADPDDDDDNDSGISSHGTAGSGASPDLSKTELATKLSTASPRNPARLKVRALWDFEPVEKSELRVAKGELIQVLYRQNDWVVAVNCNGRRGLVPFNYCSLPLRKVEYSSKSFTESMDQQNKDQVQGFRRGFDEMKRITRSSSETKVHATKLESLPGFRGLTRRSQSDDVILGINSSSSDEEFQFYTPQRMVPGQLWNSYWVVPSPVRSSSGTDEGMLGHHSGSLRDASQLASITNSSRTGFESTEVKREVTSTASKVSLDDHSDIIRNASESIFLHSTRKGFRNVDSVTNGSRTAFGNPEEELAIVATLRKGFGNLGETLPTTSFRKCPHFKAMVLYDFQARDEDDASVFKGDIVSVMNKDDEEWWWVVTPKGDEGFIPRLYLSTHLISLSEDTPGSVESASSTSESSSTQAVRFQDPLCTFHSYEREDWETASWADDEEEDYLESKYSTLC